MPRRALAASLLAAAPSLQEQPDGTFLPAVGAEGPGAYPLTFAEHAVAPTDALVDQACATRPGAQAQLAAWLGYLTGPGQAQLPEGLVALPPEMTPEWLDAFAHGMPPHGGFAIGLERWVARLTGAENIREVTLFPRDLNRLAP